MADKISAAVYLERRQGLHINSIIDHVISGIFRCFALTDGAESANSCRVQQDLQWLVSGVHRKKLDLVFHEYSQYKSLAHSSSSHSHIHSGALANYPRAPQTLNISTLATVFTFTSDINI